MNPARLMAKAITIHRAGAGTSRWQRRNGTAYPSRDNNSASSITPVPALKISARAGSKKIIHEKSCDPNFGFMRLSVIIITKNEAQNITACIDSVRFANQLIIVDSGSTDGTVALAHALGAEVIETADWPGFGPQKNRALAAADGDWVLSLDADERIPEALRDEILAAINSAQHSAYALPRLSSFCGEFIRHSGWYPDYVVRLWQRGTAVFSDHLVHEQVLVQRGTTAKLRTPIIHYS